jgi:hypothetical protein
VSFILTLGQSAVATLVATMSNQEKLQVEMVSYMKELLLLGSSMRSGMGF